MRSGVRGRSIAAFAFSVVLCWIAVSLLVHPLPHRISDRLTPPLFIGAEIAPPVTRIFDHACINCHSEKTRWPWYSQVAPVSWFVEADVKRARKRLNLSRWDRLDTTDQRLLLTAIATVIENREMPPSRYLIFHPEAELSFDESTKVIEWARTERRRLREHTAKSIARESVAGISPQSTSLLYGHLTQQEHNLEKTH